MTRNQTFIEPGIAIPAADYFPLSAFARACLRTEPARARDLIAKTKRAKLPERGDIVMIARPDSAAFIPCAPEGWAHGLHRSQQSPLTGRAAEKVRHSWHPAWLTRGAISTLVRVSQLAVLLGLGLVPAQSAPLSRFDGRWSVLAVTDRGDCSNYRYGIIVEHGRARYAGSADFTVSGSITRNGRVRAGISRGSDRADIQGGLSSEGTGSGRWLTAGSYMCSGHWTAERRSGSEGE